MNFIIESTTDILNSTGGIALVGKIFQDIGLNFKSVYSFKTYETPRGEGHWGRYRTPEASARVSGTPGLGGGARCCRCSAGA